MEDQTLELSIVAFLLLILFHRIRHKEFLRSMLRNRVKTSCRDALLAYSGTSGRIQSTPPEGRQSWHYDTLSSPHSPPGPSVATYVHTSAMGVGLTSLGHPWTGRRRLHNHYVISDPTDTTPTAHPVRHRRPQAPNGGGLLVNGRSHGGAAEHYAAWFAGQRPQGGLQQSCSGATIPGTAGRRPNQECGP